MAETSAPGDAPAADEPAADRVVKVAIVGGGCAGLAAAWELSRADATRCERFEITIYEQSWRLGGKGASGRDVNGRIREHGIHIWLGFYENAFRMMRECYEEVEEKRWGPSSAGADAVLPYGSFDQAFLPETHVGVASTVGGWRLGRVERLSAADGRAARNTDWTRRTNPFTLQAYLVARGSTMTKALIHSVLGPAGDNSRVTRPRGGGARHSTRLLGSRLLVRSDGVASGARRAIDAGCCARACSRRPRACFRASRSSSRCSASAIRRRSSAKGVLKFVEALTTQTRKQLRDLVSIDPEMRRKTEIIDLIMTIAVGRVPRPSPDSPAGPRRDQSHRLQGLAPRTAR